jgi:outer membrane protein OmpA-like peptidoglycan-associated protein
MRIFLICIISAFFFLPESLSAQTYKKFMRMGDRHFKVGNYEKAVDFYKKALKLKKGNVKATYKVGLAYLYSDDELPSLEYISRVYKLDPGIDKDIEYQLGLSLIYHERFNEAREAFEQYAQKSASRKSDVDRRIRQCTVADSLYNHPVPVEIIQLESLNSKFNDYTPLIYDNGNRLVFTSNRAGSTGGLKIYDSYYEDIYTAEKIDNEWGNINRIGPAVNLKYHDAAGSISPDGKELYLYYEYSGGNIYKSVRKNDTWGEPEPLGKEVNSVFWETSASISSDGNTLYFASERPGGFGGLDIYKSELSKEGEWLPAVNLGDKINTPQNEDSPYVTPDGSRLYFGSSGHPGMGGEDIFYVELSNGKISQPVNLGYPINSVFNDNYFMPTPNLTEGFFASMRPGGKGSADIYQVKMSATPVKAQPLLASTNPALEEKPVDQPIPAPLNNIQEKAVKEESTIYYDQNLLENQKAHTVVSVLKGKVIDSSTGAPLKAELKLVDNTTNTLLARVITDSETGDFELVIPHGGNYGVSTRKEGYLFNSLNFDMPEFQEYQEIDTHIIMRKAEAGSKVILKNIFFDIGKSDLRIESLGELDGLKELLNDNPALVVQINGHTDNIGNALANKILSKKRAESVVSYLIEQGISQQRLTAKGFGEERPIVSNDDEKDGREINRRTEIEIIKNEE